MPTRRTAVKLLLGSGILAGFACAATGCQSFSAHRAGTAYLPAPDELPAAATEPAASPFIPSHNRDWVPDLAVLPYADTKGDEVRIHNIRNCGYRADDEFVVQHYDKSFHISQMTGVDFIIVPFQQTPSLAHIMLSFGFENGDQLCVSVEARLEKDEVYSPVLGALRQYELIYVLADERDVILRRSKYRGSDVYLYRTNATPEQARLLFGDVLQRVNQIYREPEFYDAITNNCTSNIVAHINRLSPNRIPRWDPRVLFPGYTDQLAYDLGLLDTSKPFEQVKSEARISEKANRYATMAEFSKGIRR